MVNQYLPFWHFFHELEKELSYERWINKYLLFLKALKGRIIYYDDDWIYFKQFCKFLFLQNPRDEARFEELLNQGIKMEKEILLEFLKSPEKANEDKTKNSNRSAQKNKDNENQKSDSESEEDPIDGGIDPNEVSKLIEEPPGETISKNFTYRSDAIFQRRETADAESAKRKINFLVTDEYFPVTRRQMIKGWQFLRHKEKGSRTNEIDIIGTVRKISREGLFTEPVFQFGNRNREDTIIIFADYRGSMAPFHELSNRLINTALTEGGHQRAPVFYFQNYPTGYVFKTPNLSGPVKLKETLLKANRNSTLAIIISDAGAARGNTNDAPVKDRYNMTKVFLDALSESCAHTVWLNPMPTHRWRGTSAELIAKKVFIMAPVMDRETYNFQDTLRTILKIKNE